ncbi:MAG: hypothetical protein JNN07_24660 [Verrucomicrobiales bacterium]|nr:hypothetical protein [Verrucomicrobiales bacterium]
MKKKSAAAGMMAACLLAMVVCSEAELTDLSPPAFGWVLDQNTRISLQGHSGGFGTNLVLHGVFLLETPGGPLATIHFDALGGRTHYVEYKPMTGVEGPWSVLNIIIPCSGCIHHVTLDPTPVSGSPGRIYRIRVL